MAYNFYSSREYKKRQSLLVKAAWKRGDFDFFRKKEERVCRRNDCGEVFTVKPSDSKVFCSHSCSAMVNNRNRRIVRYCLSCEKKVLRPSYKYCSNACHVVHKFNSYVKRWKKGEESGLKGSLGIVSRHVKRYLREKYRNRCCLCGWSKINPKTNVVPLVADHIDGNWQNNKEKNLRLLCPNCDSLTPTFCGLNKGRGRKNRAVSKRIRISKLL